MHTQNHESTPNATQAALTTIAFHGDELDIVQEGGEHFAVLARLCEPLGIDADGQRRKLLGLAWSGAKIILAPNERGEMRGLFCLPIRSVAGWLFSVNAGKVRPELREKLAWYQRECAEVLADHFLGKRGPFAAPPAPSLTPEAVAQIVALAIGPTLATIMDRIAAMERGQTGGVVGAAIARTICSSLQETARILHQCKQGKSVASLRTRIENRLRGSVSWAGTGRSWERLPLAQHGHVLAELSVLRETAEGIRVGLGLGKQLPLRLVHAPTA